MSKNTVTSYDFRDPKFTKLNLEDFEFCPYTGEVVEKDRWQNAIYKVASLLGKNGGEFEISELVMDVRVMKYGEIVREILRPTPMPKAIKTGKVTEEDLRLDKYKGKNPEDYEIRGDGTVARKDRWEMGVRDIAFVLGFESPFFEINDVIKKLEDFVMQKNRPNTELDE